MPFRRHNEPDRVRRYTPDGQLRRIDEKMARMVRLYAAQPREMIDERIEELRREWSIERFLQLNAAAIGLTTALLAVTRNRKWGFATCGALGFFLLHATDGFDPPLPLLRQLGVRSRAEIDREIYALKLLRGDFDGVEPLEAQDEPPQIRHAAEAVGV
jgi:hypothetical protein